MEVNALVVNRLAEDKKHIQNDVYDFLSLYSEKENVELDQELKHNLSIKFVDRMFSIIDESNLKSYNKREREIIQNIRTSEHNSDLLGRINDHIVETVEETMDTSNHEKDVDYDDITEIKIDMYERGMTSNI